MICSIRWLRWSQSGFAGIRLAEPHLATPTSISALFWMVIVDSPVLLILFSVLNPWLHACERIKLHGVFGFLCTIMVSDLFGPTTINYQYLKFKTISDQYRAETDPHFSLLSRHCLVK